MPRRGCAGTDNVAFDADSLGLHRGALRPLRAPALLRGRWRLVRLRVQLPDRRRLQRQRLRLRRQGEMPPASEMIQSPYDPDARYSEKRQLAWEGYKVHLSESCDDARPRLDLPDLDP